MFQFYLLIPIWRHGFAVLLSQVGCDNSSKHMNATISNKLDKKGESSDEKFMSKKKKGHLQISQTLNTAYFHHHTIYFQIVCCQKALNLLNAKFTILLHSLLSFSSNLIIFIPARSFFLYLSQKRNSFGTFYYLPGNWICLYHWENCLKPEQNV